MHGINCTKTHGPRLVAAFALCLAACVSLAQEPSHRARQTAPDNVLKPICAHPYRQTVTIQLPANYSGVAGMFDFGASRHLRVDTITARLHQPGFRGAHLGGNTNGAFGWHVLRNQGDRAVHSAARDGAIYLDRGSLGKVVIYRNGAAAAGSGEFTVSGCLVSTIPRQLRMPDVRGPRLPPKFLLPGDKLKLDVEAARPATR